MTTAHKKILPALLIFCFMGLLVGAYVNEFNHINRTLGIGRLMALSAFAGAVAGFVFAYAIQSKYSDVEAKIRVFSVAVVVGVVLLPLLSSMLNRALGDEPVPTPVLFEAEQPFYSNRLGLIKGEVIRPTGYFLFFYKDEQLFRITNKNSISKNLSRGDTIMLPIRKGFFGADWVDTRIPVKN